MLCQRCACSTVCCGMVWRGLGVRGAAYLRRQWIASTDVLLVLHVLLIHHLLLLLRSERRVARDAVVLGNGGSRSLGVCNIFWRIAVLVALDTVLVVSLRFGSIEARLRMVSCGARWTGGFCDVLG